MSNNGYSKNVLLGLRLVLGCLLLSFGLVHWWNFHGEMTNKTKGELQEIQHFIERKNSLNFQLQQIDSIHQALERSQKIHRSQVLEVEGKASVFFRETLSNHGLKLLQFVEEGSPKKGAKIRIEGSHRQLIRWLHFFRSQGKILHIKELKLAKKGKKESIAQLEVSWFE